MSRTACDSRGEDLARRFREGRIQSQRAARPGARALPLLTGVKPCGQFTLPLENVLVEAGNLLIATRRVFRRGNSVVLEAGDSERKRLVPIAVNHQPESSAAALLANLFICSHVAGETTVQFPPPYGFVQLLVTNEPLAERLPRIHLYSQRPVFDQDFRFRGPGWHEDVGYLVHGPDVEPILPACGPLADIPHGRVPTRIRELLRDFCFKDESDRVNAIGLMLTGLLMPHFVRPGKAVALLDGNQPGVGKTLLARVIGIILDGTDPKLIEFTTNDEELGKRACAILRENNSSLILFDNAKLSSGIEINSPFIEANSMAPEISLRILGQSVTYTQPNDLLWFVTMNSTKASSDLVSRCVPIRFHFDGDPRVREFQGHDLTETARRLREEILGELAGMVIVWNQLGRPPGRQRHRLSHWASIIGGILDANGLFGFLINLSEAVEQFNTALDELAAVAEAAIRLGSPMVVSLPVIPIT